MPARKKGAWRDTPLRWIAEPLMDDPTYIDKPMFGCMACYVRGLLVLVLSEGEEPWNGVLVPTFKEHHASLVRDFAGLRQHPVLGKWLYLPMDDEAFEGTASAIAESISAGDGRFGVEPSDKKRGGKKKRGKQSVKK